MLPSGYSIDEHFWLIKNCLWDLRISPARRTHQHMSCLVLIVAINKLLLCEIPCNK